MKHISFNRRTFLSLLLLSFALVVGTTHSPAQAASTKPEPPDGPMLNPAPSPGQWVITFSYPDEREKKTAGDAAMATFFASTSQTRSITTTKTKNIVHEETVDRQGGKLDIWHVGAIQYTKLTDSPIWQQHQAGDSATGAGFTPLPASGYRDLGWISKNTYVGTIKLQDHSCLVFVQHPSGKVDLTNPETLSEKLESMGAFAFIDAVTRLPVQVQANGIISYYKFADSPSDNLSLPPDLADQIKKGDQSRALLGQPAPKPPN